MSLDLTTPQPADPAGPAETPPFCTLVTTEGTVLRLTETPEGGVSILVGARQPAVLDRFQAGALRAAILTFGEG